MVQQHSGSSRRSRHTPEELRQLILTAATELIEENGLEGLSAREVARRVEYSAGTLYNVFRDRDDIILTIESKLLDDLDEHLDAVRGETPRQHVLALATAYLEFTSKNARLWNLLFEHRLAKGRAAPAWYQEKIDRLMTRIEEALEPVTGPGSNREAQRAARVLWAGVHGITSLSTADKLSNVTHEAAKVLIEDLVSTYLNGLEKAKDAGGSRWEASSQTGMTRTAGPTV